MFTALDHTLAYQRREETARQVSSGRLKNELRDAQACRRENRWPVRRLARMLRASSSVNAEA